MPATHTRSAADGDWMMAMMQSPGFQRLTADQIECLFRQMQEVPVRAGQIIFRQGEIGTHYYVIKSGSAAVSRWNGHEEQELAVLSETASFGEDALISDCARNATVRMNTNGVLMRLSRDDFGSLLQSHLIDEVDYAQTRQMTKAGAVRIDVRSRDEFDRSALRGAVSMPLDVLRERLNELDPAIPYIVYCNTGDRSAAAAFLMSLRGFDVRVLAGGLRTALH